MLGWQESGRPPPMLRIQDPASSLSVPTAEWELAGGWRPEAISVEVRGCKSTQLERSRRTPCVRAQRGGSYEAAWPGAHCESPVQIMVQSEICSLGDQPWWQILGFCSNERFGPSGAGLCRMRSNTSEKAFQGISNVPTAGNNPSAGRTSQCRLRHPGSAIAIARCVELHAANAVQQPAVFAFDLLDSSPLDPRTEKLDLVLHGPIPSFHLLYVISCASQDVCFPRLVGIPEVFYVHVLHWALSRGRMLERRDRLTEHFELGVEVLAVFALDLTVRGFGLLCQRLCLVVLTTGR